MHHQRQQAAALKHMRFHQRALLFQQHDWHSELGRAAPRLWSSESQRPAARVGTAAQEVAAVTTVAFVWNETNE